MEEMITNIAGSMVAARSRALGMDVPSTLQVFSSFHAMMGPKGLVCHKWRGIMRDKCPVLTQ